MSKQANEAFITKLTEFLKKENDKARKNLDKIAGIYYAQDDYIKANLRYYGIYGKTADSIVKGVQDKARDQAQKYGVVWLEREKVLIIHEVALFSTKTVRSTYSLIQRYLNKYIRDRIIKLKTAKNKDKYKLPQTGHIQEANVVESVRSKLSSEDIKKEVFGTDTLSETDEQILATIQSHYRTAQQTYRKESAEIIKKYTGLDVYSEFNKILSKSNEIDGTYFTVQYGTQSYRLNQELLRAIELPFVDNLIASLPQLKGSKSLEEGIDNNIVAGFDPSKANKKSIKNKKKSKRKISASGISRASLLQNSAIINNKLRTSTGQFTNVLSIKALMNTRLHEAVRTNMGKGSSALKLNYRTGRFAKSATIENISQAGDNLLVDYSYMNDPYDVFRPGGRLYKPGRDPEKIINRSIRQLAVQLVNKRFKVTPRLI